jgi:hypothetical protein
MQGGGKEDGQNPIGGGSISSKNGKINYAIPTFVENLDRTMIIL